MRKLLILVLAVLMPLQWSSAAVVSLCLEELAGHARGAAQAAAHGEAHAHAGHDAHPSAAGREPVGRQAHGHHLHAHHGDGAGADDGRHARADGAGGPAGDDGQAGASTSYDGPGCCHAGVSLPPSDALLLPVQTLPRFAGLAPPMPPLSHASEGPFRPPRALSA